MHRWILIFLFITPGAVFSQDVPLVNAHAHNDYEHRHPLFDAIANGFNSVEADIHLSEGKILVSHDRPDRSAKTLESLYLKPLDSIRKVNNGSIYPHSAIPFFLMIDIKTDGAETFKALRDILSNYTESLNRGNKSGAVQVFISGNRPFDLIISDPDHLTAIDGRPSDLGKGFSSALMPVISDNYTNIAAWSGKGTPSAKDIEAVKRLAGRAHAENKKLRLWNIPDNPKAWQFLLDCGVDLINTDKLEELNTFLTSGKPR